MSNTFYPLTHDEFLRLNQDLKDAELRVYLYLMTLNPFPNSVMEIDTARISEQLCLTRRTIQRAIKRLQELQLIEIEITKFKYKKVVHGSYSRLGSGDTRIANQDFSDPYVATSDPYVAASDPYVAASDPYVAASDTRIVSNDIQIANTPPKPLSDKDSGTSQNNKYINFTKTLSEAERANFLNFCVEKTKNLQQEVNDIEAWLAHTNKAGQNRWEVYYEKYIAAEKLQAQKTQTRVATKNALEEFHRELEEQTRQVKADWERRQAEKAAESRQNDSADNVEGET